jgi:hypothetical protein
MEKDYTYNFVTSQPLTQKQIDWLNEQLLEVNKKRGEKSPLPF